MRGHIKKLGVNSYSLAVSLGKDANTSKYKYPWVSVKGTKNHDRIAPGHLKSLPSERPVVLPAACLTTLLPTLPFLTALTSPIILATLYKELRNPIGSPPFFYGLYRLKV